MQAVWLPSKVGPNSVIGSLISTPLTRRMEGTKPPHSVLSNGPKGQPEWKIFSVATRAVCPKHIQVQPVTMKGNYEG